MDPASLAVSLLRLGNEIAQNGTWFRVNRDYATGFMLFNVTAYAPHGSVLYVRAEDGTECNCSGHDVARLPAVVGSTIRLMVHPPGGSGEVWLVTVEETGLQVRRETAS